MLVAEPVPGVAVDRILPARIVRAHRKAGREFRHIPERARFQVVQRVDRAVELTLLQPREHVGRRHVDRGRPHRIGEGRVDGRGHPQLGTLDLLERGDLARAHHLVERRGHGAEEHDAVPVEHGLHLRIRGVEVVHREEGGDRILEPDGERGDDIVLGQVRRGVGARVIGHLHQPVGQAGEVGHRRQQRRAGIELHRQAAVRPLLQLLGQRHIAVARERMGVGEPDARGDLLREDRRGGQQAEQARAGKSGQSLHVSCSLLAGGLAR